MTFVYDTKRPKHNNKYALPAPIDRHRNDSHEEKHYCSGPLNASHDPGITAMAKPSEVTAVGAEHEHIGKEIARIEGEVGKPQAMLSNEGFVTRAKPEVVEQDRKRLADFTSTLATRRDRS